MVLKYIKHIGIKRALLGLENKMHLIPALIFIYFYGSRLK